jgi:hypothetical protein
MLDDWRDRQLTRLECDMTTLKSEMWALEADVRRRFWERDQRRLQILSWIVMGLPWIAVGVLIAAAAIKGH